jgi:hypothetical protein
MLYEFIYIYKPLFVRLKRRFGDCTLSPSSVTIEDGVTTELLSTQLGQMQLGPDMQTISID